MAVNSTALAIASSVTQLLTALLGLFRLGFRLKIRRFWWEDVWAAVAMVGAVADATVVLISFYTKSAEIADITRWISVCLFTSIIWSVRMSLLYSIVRVISPFTYLRNFARAIGIFFVIVWIVILVLKIWWCVRSQELAIRHSACHISSPIAIFQLADAYLLAADFTGDATLVVLSLRLLWRVKLPRRQRRIILSIFSCSAVMSMISLPRAIAQVAFNTSVQYILADSQLTASLVVCNLLVIVTYIYRVYLSSSDSESESSSEDDDFTTPAPRSPQSLTTVDLDASDPVTTGATTYFRSGSSPSTARSSAT